MDEIILEEIRKTNRLLSMILTKDSTFNEKLALLKNAGLSSKEIAGIIGTSTATISVSLSKLKKVKNGKRK